MSRMPKVFLSKYLVLLELVEIRFFCRAEFLPLKIIFHVTRKFVIKILKIDIRAEFFVYLIPS